MDETNRGVRDAQHLLPHRPSSRCGKFLHTMVERIHHIQAAGAVEGEGVRNHELAGFGAGAAEDTGEELAVRSELLNPAAHGADPEAAVFVEAQADGALQAHLRAGRHFDHAAEAAGLVGIIAPGQKRFALRGELLNAAVAGFGGPDVAGGVERDKLWPAGARLYIRLAAELAALVAVLAPL